MIYANGNPCPALARHKLWLGSIVYLDSNPPKITGPLTQYIYMSKQTKNNLHRLVSTKINPHTVTKINNINMDSTFSAGGSFS